MRAGQLRDLVELQERFLSRAGDGERTEKWVTTNSVWAKIWEMRGKELLLSRELHAEVDVKIWIRYRSDIDRSWRVKFGSRIFDIHGMSNTQGRNQELLMMCKEIIA